MTSSYFFSVLCRFWGCEVLVSDDSRSGGISSRRLTGTDISASGADLERAMGGASSDGLGWEAERDGCDGWREERGGMMIFNGGSG